MMKLRWPRERILGRKVVGIRIKFAIILDDWAFKPEWVPYFDEFAFLCFRLHIGLETSRNIDYNQMEQVDRTEAKQKPGGYLWHMAQREEAE